MIVLESVCLQSCARLLYPRVFRGLRSLWRSSCVWEQLGFHWSREEMFDHHSERASHLIQSVAVYESFIATETRDLSAGLPPSSGQRRTRFRGVNNKGLPNAGHLSEADPNMSV